MLVLEFEINDCLIDAWSNDNIWIKRAAQSLAEALRLCTSKKLDVEFSELVTGYRLRKGKNASFVDIYLYDSLSSGAGYAVSVAESISDLLQDVEELLESCNCTSACSRCLKHYRNQYFHGSLDRFAALELLRWGRKGKRAEAITTEKQMEIVQSLENILKESGHMIIIDNGIHIQKGLIKKKLVVYPAMWIEPHEDDTIFVHDAYIKYAKPYALQKILEQL